ncbi:hypothetical protein [Saccharothrix luteola]|uniref:hypothetical protein n=1 Tax=Saccharothrix luteola TaxID=2893018 RepID=UPI001E537328|nr:hypothetical protein [Saccharothrix luteola]MCC8247657.1 hypothetical protein [Saccharothrix luteola]
MLRPVESKPADVDHAWLHRLCDLGAELATTLPASLLLATAFRHAAQALRTRGHLHLAAVHGMRELAIHRLRDDDPDATAAALHDLAQTYRAQDLPHKVIGCADEALETYLLHHHDTGIAHTLLHLGTLMIGAERYDSAVKYLTRADTLHQHLSNPTEHAHCLANLGRALRQTGNHTTAHRALSLIIGNDDLTTRNIRGLVTAARQP